MPLVINQDTKLDLSNGDTFTVKDNELDSNVYTITPGNTTNFDYTTCNINTNGNRGYNTFGYIFESTTGFHDTFVDSSFNDVRRDYFRIVGGRTDLYTVDDFAISSFTSNVSLDAREEIIMDAQDVNIKKNRTFFRELKLPHDGSSVKTPFPYNQGSIALALSARGDGITSSNYQTPGFSGSKQAGSDGVFFGAPDMPGTNGESIITEWIDGSDVLSFRFNVDVSGFYGAGSTEIAVSSFSAH